MSSIESVLSRLGEGAVWLEDVYIARKAGRLEQNIPVNHSEFFVPVIRPTLNTGTEALVVAAMAYLGK